MAKKMCSTFRVFVLLIKSFAFLIISFWSSLWLMELTTSIITQNNNYLICNYFVQGQTV